VYKNDYAYNAIADQLEGAIGDSMWNVLSNFDYNSMFERYNNGEAGAGAADDFGEYLF